MVSRGPHWWVQNLTGDQHDGENWWQVKQWIESFVHERGWGEGGGGLYWRLVWRWVETHIAKGPGTRCNFRLLQPAIPGLQQSQASLQHTRRACRRFAGRKGEFLSLQESCSVVANHKAAFRMTRWPIALTSVSAYEKSRIVPREFSLFGMGLRGDRFKVAKCAVSTAIWIATCGRPDVADVKKLQRVPSS